MSPWFILLPFGGIAWWLLGFPPGWDWIVLPLVPPMPISLGFVVVLGSVVVGLCAGLVWVRDNL